ncbi:MAG: hypothetical protein IPM16_21690 [Chloroflexi bacterium]|nr:hypothetical protein [Chloroflexota bacterium]
MDDSVSVTPADSRQIEPLPYAPSWIDRLTEWVDRQSYPPAAFYALIALVLVIIQSAIQWQAGTYHVGTFSAYHIYFTLIAVYFVGLMHFLDRSAARAWVAYSAAIDTESAAVKSLEYRLTTLPARRTLVAGLCGVAVAVITLIAGTPIVEQLNIVGMGTTTLSVAYNSIGYFVNWIIVGTFTYHIIHQLRVISRIYRLTRVDLYNLGPLYAFSGVSARTAVGVALAMYSPVFILAGFSDSAVWTIVRFASMAVVAFTFVWPLLGVHRLMEREKDARLRENARLMESTFAELHRRIEADDLTNIENLNRAIDGLQTEQRTLSAIPTWPWRPETPRAVLAAILLPVVVWLIQFVLERVLVTP